MDALDPDHALVSAGRRQLHWVLPHATNGVGPCVCRRVLSADLSDRVGIVADMQWHGVRWGASRVARVLQANQPGQCQPAHNGLAAMQ